MLYTYLKKSTEKLRAKSFLWAKLDMRILQRLALKYVLYCILLYGSVSQGLGTTKLTNLIG